MILHDISMLEVAIVVALWLIIFTFVLFILDAFWQSYKHRRRR